jgi:hypothetical protein
VRLLVTTPYNYRYDSDSHDAPSIHHAWRESIFHITTVTKWNYNTTVAGIKKQYADARAAIEGLRELSDAAYLNESDVYEEDWESASAMSHLLEIQIR